MFAYSPDGSPIIDTVEDCPGKSAIVEGSFMVIDGKIEFEHEGYTLHDYNAQATVIRNGEEVFADEKGRQWLASEVILLETRLKPGAIPNGFSLPASTQKPLVIRTYSIHEPVGGLRPPGSFDAAEKARLRPIAEVLAMLDHNNPAGPAHALEGEDMLYEHYLPEAAALFASTPACHNGPCLPTAGLVQHMRGHTGAPSINPTGLRAIALTSAANQQLLRISNIVWDLSDPDSSDQSVTGDGQDLPTTLIAAVEANVEISAIPLAERLSDCFGFCVTSFAVDVMDD